MPSENDVWSDLHPAQQELQGEAQLNWEVAWSVFEARLSHAIKKAPHLYTSEKDGLNYRWAPNMQIYHWDEFEEYYGKDARQKWDMSYRLINDDLQWYMSKELVARLHMTQEDIRTLKQNEKIQRDMIAEYKGRRHSFPHKWSYFSHANVV